MYFVQIFIPILWKFHAEYAIIIMWTYFPVHNIFVNGGIVMSKKAIITLTVSLSATVLLVGAATATEHR